MTFALGVVIFALGITISIALHEAGHLVTAKVFGMKVRRYFIGFGPRIFSFRRGETEYGLKAILAGGFCDIAGMTALDPVTEEEAPRAFFKAKTWKRVVVLSAGSAAHFLIGILLIYALAVTAGLPNLQNTPVANEVTCAPLTQNATTGELAPCDAAAPSPARDAGMLPGDKIVSVGEMATATYDGAVKVIRASNGPTPFVIERDGQQLTLNVNVAPVQRLAAGAKQGDPNNKLETVGAIGVSNTRAFTYGPLEAIPGTFAFTGTMFAQVWQGLISFPEKLPAVVDAIGGGERDADTPVSVVGASIIGGDAAEAGLWAFFVLLLALLNLFVGVFNLLPLLPLDGGHIAVNLYEKVRDTVRRRLGKVQLPPVDYTRLLPLTYAFMLILGAIGLLTVTADIVNPIRLQ
ncbi:MAG: site-2 protease family protein [Pseudonocardiales bacterium]|nr:site-2 protease family protein [Pseudonocardiales bacterium]